MRKSTKEMGFVMFHTFSHEEQAAEMHPAMQEFLGILR